LDRALSIGAIAEEQQLSRHRELIDALMEHTPDHVYFKDTDGRFLRVSRSMADWVGLEEPAQAIGKTDFDFYGRTHAEAARADELEIMRTGRPLVGIEEREVWQDGRVTWVSTTKVPLRDGNGRIIGTFGTSRDITEHKRDEEALRLSRFSLDNAADAIFWLRPDALFTYVNDSACRLLGYTREELLSMTVHDVNPDHPREVWPAYWSELKQRRSLTFEGNLRTKDGKLVTVELTANHLEFEGREFNCSFARDITERKRAEQEKSAMAEQLRQSQKMEAIGQLAGGIAHDFNNLVSVINGYGDFLIHELAEGDPRRSDVEQILEAGEHAASLTAQLLAFSRKQVVQPKILDLNGLLADASTVYRRLIGEDIQLVAKPAPDLGRIEADPGQIHQILMNLVLNARDAMPRGGKLTIETCNADLDETYAHSHSAITPGGYVMLAVSDTGIGMDEGTKSRLFEPFFTTKEAGKGTGLGLSTVYGIVKQSQGFIWVYSEPERGTTFKIYFPRVMDEAGKIARALKAEPELQGTETILVVEDAALLRATIVRALRKRGYTVLDASNGPEALDKARDFAGRIHMLLTDVVMPEMSGKAVASELEIARPGIRTLYVSGYTNQVIVQYGVLDINTAFLPKPFTNEMLARKVREVLDCASPARSNR
jgi:PAS domain S-box-containing protein